jgi:hypothetical protein
MKEFIVNYWSQISVIIMLIMGIIKILADYFIKRKEIQFSAINKNRIDTIKDYVIAYNELHYTLTQFINYSAFGSYTDKKIQEHATYVRNGFNAINSTTLLVKLFSTNEEAVLITNINEQFRVVVYEINKWFINKESQTKHENPSTIFKIQNETLPKTIPNLMDELTGKLKLRIK